MFNFKKRYLFFASQSIPHDFEENEKGL